MCVKRIITADDHALTRKGIELVLKSTYPYTEIIEATDGNDALVKYKLYEPDVMIMDYSMPGMNGFDAAFALLKEFKEARIILLTMFDTRTIAVNFIKIGGKGFIWKGNPNQDICDGVRVVASGDYYFSSEYESEMMEWIKCGTSQKVPTIKFTPLELAIVEKLSKGKTSKEISRELSLSPRTVETYRYDLIKKTAVKNSVELIEYAFQNGITAWGTNNTSR